MSTSQLTWQKLLGLFELDGNGTVLYHRMDSDGEPDGTSLEMAGHNFYDQVASFKNVEAFRRCVTEFTSGAKSADSFDFDCEYEDSDHSVRVLLARICEGVNRNNTKSVLVHIRQGKHSQEAPVISEVTDDERDVDE